MLPKGALCGQGVEEWKDKKTEKHGLRDRYMGKKNKQEELELSGERERIRDQFRNSDGV